MEPRSELRDWLILSRKWSKYETVMWYATGCKGYTDNILVAGRYTESEAAAMCDNSDDELLAIHIADAMAFATTTITVRINGSVISKLKEESNKRRSK